MQPLYEDSLGYGFENPTYSNDTSSGYLVSCRCWPFPPTLILATLIYHVGVNSSTLNGGGYLHAATQV